MWRNILALSFVESLMASEQHVIVDIAVAPEQLLNVSLSQEQMEPEQALNVSLFQKLVGAVADFKPPGWLADKSLASWGFEILLHGALCAGVYLYFRWKPWKRSPTLGGERNTATTSVSPPVPQPNAMQQKVLASQREAQPAKDRLSHRLNMHAIRGQLQQMTWTLQIIEKYYRHCLDMQDYQRVIVHLARGGDPAGAHKWLRRAVQLGLQPQHGACTSVIRGYVSARDYAQAKQVACEMSSACLKFDTVTYNTMIHLCLCSGDADAGQMWMERMLSEGVQPNAVSFATVMQVCSSADLLNDLDKWFAMSQQQGFRLKARTFDSMLGDFERRDDDVNAFKWLSIMIESGVQPEISCFHRVLNLFIKRVDVDGAGSVIAIMPDMGVGNAASIYSRCIVMAATNGHGSRAQQWADEFSAGQGKLTRQARQAMCEAGLTVPRFRRPVTPRRRHDGKPDLISGL